ncbi:DUF192 domain-containing protein [Rhodobacterales bacterium]|nr:DUF192 domain-containing protein [Rhodobacterales bacterium]
MCRRTVSTAVAALFLGLASLSPGAAQEAQQTLPTEPLEIQSHETVHRFTVEVAATERQRARGLMFREEMGGDEGMLFVFDREGERYFWMKNTPLPLDIIYIDQAGKIVSIAADTTPFSESVIPSGKPARYALELNAGSAKRLGIEVGNDVTSPSMGVE